MYAAATKSHRSRDRAQISGYVPISLLHCVETDPHIQFPRQLQPFLGFLSNWPGESLKRLNIIEIYRQGESNTLGYFI